jgi:hypothetical protein
MKVLVSGLEAICLERLHLCLDIVDRKADMVVRASKRRGPYETAFGPSA